MSKNVGIVLILAGAAIALISLMFSTSTVPAEAGFMKSLPFLEIVFHYGEPQCSRWGCSFPDKIFIYTKYVLSIAVTMAFSGVGIIAVNKSENGDE
jgi:hypothetical protein